MPSLSEFRTSKESYGRISSWAVWDLSNGTAGFRNVSIFDEPSIIDELQSNYVLIGLNLSHTSETEENSNFQNFHSGPRRGNHDRRLPPAIIKTVLWGSYMTDLIKDLTDPNEGSVRLALQQNPSLIERNIATLTNELAEVGAKDAKLVAMGGLVHSQLLKAKMRGMLPNEILKISHYSAWQIKNYTDRVREEIKSFALL